jgi:hypothetical protein
LEGQPPDPRILPALESAFERGKTAEEKQWIAATLIRLGEKSSTYFEYLADQANEAISDRTPFFVKYDHGKSVSGEFDAGFLNWCAENHKNPREIAALQLNVYFNDVRILAYAQDPRALTLLRAGLESPNVLVVASSVEGLGRLHDAAALPLIEKSLDRAELADRTAIARQLCWFRVPQAERLFEKFVPNVEMRDYHRREIQMLQFSEENRALRRLAKPK